MRRSTRGWTGSEIVSTKARRRRTSALFPLATLFAVLLAVPLAGQPPVFESTERIDADRPEAWAMATFTSVSLLTGLGAPPASAAGDLELGVELGWIPQLDERQRTVGFDGRKEEDLNKSDVFARLRVRFGLPASWSLTVGWVPPVEVGGVESHLVALALERPLVQSDRLGLGVRVYGQLGTSEGDFTCSSGPVSQPVGSPGNRFGCEALSEDEVTMGYYGAEVVGSARLGSRDGTIGYLGIALNRLDTEFQVDALTFGVRDRTRLLAEQWTFSTTAGVSWRSGDRLRWAAELFYTPLEVKRRDRTGVESDDLLNARLLAAFRLR